MISHSYIYHWQVIVYLKSLGLIISFINAIRGCAGIRGKLSSIYGEWRKLERVIQVLDKGPMLELHDCFGTCWRGSYISISRWRAIFRAAVGRTIRNRSVVRLLIEAIRCERIGDARVAGLDKAIINWIVETL